MEDIVYENVYDSVTGATGNLWAYDTDIIEGYDTVVFDAFGDGDLSSAYDWQVYVPSSAYYEGVAGGGITLTPSGSGGTHIDISSPDLRYE